MQFTFYLLSIHPSILFFFSFFFFKITHSVPLSHYSFSARLSFYHAHSRILDIAAVFSLSLSFLLRAYISFFISYSHFSLPQFFFITFSLSLRGFFFFGKFFSHFPCAYDSTCLPRLSFSLSLSLSSCVPASFTVLCKERKRENEISEKEGWERENFCHILSLSLCFFLTSKKRREKKRWRGDRRRKREREE